VQEDPYKMWFSDGFEVGLMVVRTSGSFDCAGGRIVFIPFVEVYVWQPVCLLLFEIRWGVEGSVWGSSLWWQILLVVGAYSSLYHYKDLLCISFHTAFLVSK
jgi:hypothetical protein